VREMEDDRGVGNLLYEVVKRTNSILVEVSVCWEAANKSLQIVTAVLSNES
jgi:hypothetical protein